MSPRNEAGDGRNVDPRLGSLQGEGAAQRIATDPKAQPDGPLWTEPASAEAVSQDPAYYDRTVLKEPVWIWSVPAYFFTGGAAGAAAALGAAATIVPGLDGLVIRARWLSAAGVGIGTAFLIHDLGRPERFLNMLRVFRPSSPMSVGSWVLAGAGPLFALSAVLSRAEGVAGQLGDAASLMGGLLGLPLAGYTAVLVSTTAVPLWQASARSLPFLFMASAASSATSILTLARLDEKEEAVVDRLGTMAEIAELVAAYWVERAASKVERVGRPYKEGLSGTLWKTSTALTTAGLAIGLLPGRSRVARSASGIAGIASGLCLRFAIFHAGKASARDPRATFHYQRQSPEPSGAL